VLVLVNTEMAQASAVTLAAPAAGNFPLTTDLLGQALPQITSENEGLQFTLLPGAVHCLAAAEQPAGLSGEDYRQARARAAFAIQALNRVLPVEVADGLDWRWLAEQVRRSPQNFLAAASECAARNAADPLPDVLAEAGAGNVLPRVIGWTLLDARRITPVPPGHWLLVEDSAPFRASLSFQPAATGSRPPVHVQSISLGDRHVACFVPRETFAEAELNLERYATTSQKVRGAIRFLGFPPAPSRLRPQPSDLVLLTNGIGGMARLCVDLGRVNSKYDCALGANLHPSLPVDRHVFVKRLRVWVNADGFISPLNFSNLAGFDAGPPAVWKFVANAGDGRTVEIELGAEMLRKQNTVVFKFHRPAANVAHGKQLPAGADVRLTVRPDLEDRNFHSETQRNAGAEFHFAANTHSLPLPGDKSAAQTGFAFTPAADRQLRVFADGGEYHPQPEWCENIPHPVEQTRGQTGGGDAYSPGWFDLPLAKGATATLVLTAELAASATGLLAEPPAARRGSETPSPATAEAGFESRLVQAAQQFVVRRDAGKTVIAGYPWFLDWGRDSLICARGLLAAGLTRDVKDLLLTFAKFEQNGTLPNTIHGDDVSNRDTSDAPLWFAVVCEDLGEAAWFSTSVGGSRTVREVLTSIAENYSQGTPNGICMDAASALIWSPSHFTWMDTNHPAGTPREGYPVEIQALWIRLLRLLEKISDEPGRKKWRDLADRATVSFEKLFWLEDKGWFADVLIAQPRVSARDAVPGDALRSNCLLAVSLGLVAGERAKRCVAAAQKYLVVPGALRSLAPLPVSVPQPIWRDGRLMNDPHEPYRPRYEGDEDTRRKLAYHNGTAWTWTFPTFCEALARAWNYSPEAIASAQAYLASADKIFNAGCIGQLPEILDGDAPHPQRGCDAQAWSVTEFLRVWKRLASVNL
jgi:predicted glycogen debranching enzyme